VTSLIVTAHIFYFPATDRVYLRGFPEIGPVSTLEDIPRWVCGRIREEWLDIMSVMVAGALAKKPR
jgi:hypothetical protein